MSDEVVDALVGPLARSSGQGPRMTRLRGEIAYAVGYFCATAGSVRLREGYGPEVHFDFDDDEDATDAAEGDDEAEPADETAQERVAR